jgi:hypothetical protein
MAGQLGFSSARALPSGVAGGSGRPVGVTITGLDAPWGCPMNCLPQARVDVRNVDLGSELVIYDERHGLFHILNSTARRIWQLCDGTHGVDEIVGEMTRMFPHTAVETLRQDVERTLASLKEKEVIVYTEVERAKERAG